MAQKDSGRKVLLYLGRIHPKKGLVNLIKAWAAVQGSQGPMRDSRAPSWLLAIAGWGQDGHEAELKRLATGLGIRWAEVRQPSAGTAGKISRVDRSWVPDSQQGVSLLFAGPQFGEAKSECYRNCDAFILPSFSEGLPMAILEAWAQAKPVLMSPECNLPEGFAVEAAIRIEPNPESIAKGIQDLFAAPCAALLALGENGRRLVSKRFAWPLIAGDMKAVYDWVLGGGTKPECVIER